MAEPAGRPARDRARRTRRSSPPSSSPPSAPTPAGRADGARPRSRAAARPARLARLPVRLPAGPAGVLAAVAVLALVTAFPLVELLAAAIDQGPGAVAAAFGQAGSLRAAANTVWTAAAVTALSVTGGTAAALVTERSAAPGRRALRVGVLLTLLVPSFVSAQSWAQAYGPSGLTEDLLGVALPRLFGPVGVVTVLAVHTLPLAYLVVAAALASRAEPDLERAARTAGASGWVAFRTVTLPLLRPALLAAAALSFVTAVNAFGIPAILGLPGRFVTLTTRIYRDLAFAADPAAFTRVVVLAASLVVLALLVVGAADAIAGLRGPVTRTGAPAGGATATGRRSWGPALGLTAFLAATTGVPLAALLLTALTRGVGLAPSPANWTLANFAEALSTTAVRALRNSLLLAVAAATAAVLLGGLLAALQRRRFGRPLGTAAILTFAVPGSALAVAVLLAYGPWLRDTLLLILVAYLAKFWALGHRTIAGSVEGLPADVSRAARVSGAGPLTDLRTVTVPLLLPALVGAWLLVFVTAVHELTMSALLYGPGSETIAVLVLNAQQLGDVTVTSALAVLLTALVLLASAPLLLLRPRP